MTTGMLRAATVAPTATTPVLVEIDLDGERRPIKGWRLEGCPRGDENSDPPKAVSPHILVLELGRYEEVDG
jgi:hypothetical protein